MANRNEQLTHFVRLLQSQGHRLTPARRTILEALITSGGHLTADDLADLVRQEQPGIGRMTVYRTLDLLNELGLIRPVYQGTGAAHYVLMHDGHHHHLVCSTCDQVIEFEECVLEEIAQQLGGRFNFQVQGHLLEFYGLCEACRQ
jgi:Fur family transcriptional regulator, ferric uptake regulator